MSDSAARLVVRGLDHVDPGGSIVGSGLVLAEAIITAIDVSGRVEVDLTDIKGASSSYFNVLLLRLQEAGQLGALEKRVAFRFGSDIQDQVYRKSLAALQRKLAKAEKEKQRQATRSTPELPELEQKPRKGVFRDLFRPKGSA